MGPPALSSSCSNACGTLWTSELAIDLGRRNMGMTEQFLHGAQFFAFLEHKKSKGVSQHLRGDIGDACLACIPLDNQPETLPCQPLPMVIQEKRLLIGVTLD